ncbi:hypothetical protein [Terrihabitans rhizophilus]|uniref:Uncharacterized protein n=1 Tax=Terrihabitans rhizophilus TaxID=3092662 RepID=A0ABU4RJJ2_9HYPH|nr:hypothetical protein [Terrihabitans sp. PJ23]MDX6805012.1 hypothetical protein [Terrihabitans sp. PJ23]
MDMGAIAGAIGSLKTASEMAKAVMDLRDASAIQSKVIDLQSVIVAAQSSALSAQSDQFTLMHQLRGLQSKLEQLEGWDATKRRYLLKDYGGATFAYELRANAAEGEPIHRICPACYEKKIRSVLQFSYNASGRDTYDCHSCGKKMNFGIEQIDWSPRNKAEYF